jgi:acetolactate synthase-1/2/3 large subunit
MKYSDQITDWLIQMGYTHCFYVGGGNIMHLIESFSRKLECVPVIHEVAAAIATEYFNEASADKKAVALVTAGPGLTNAVTGIAAAYLESRELLIIGGQVKTPDLARGQLRQRGIQEIDGVSIVKSITVRAELIDDVIDFDAFANIINHPEECRKGPVFLEIPIDIQGREVNFTRSSIDGSLEAELPLVTESDFEKLLKKIKAAKRPTILLGGGVTRETTKKLKLALASMPIPIATTWNAADRVPSDQLNYVGRPNTWGQRSANLVIQQSDLLIAVGTRLGMQQTGFNWQQFIPNGEIVQVEIDQAELDKGHPKVAMPMLGDANELLERLVAQSLGDHSEWLSYAQKIRATIPLIEPINKTADEYISPFVFADMLSKLCVDNDIIIPCSSGGAFTVMMQTFQQKTEQIIITDKGLASMGYGLSGAIGAAVAYPDRRVVLVEGDGGFSQNVQEIGTAAINNLNLKIFIFDDSGYASIRATQRNYFGGRYVGCDRNTGLGLPDWEKLFSAWNVPVLRINKEFTRNSDFISMFQSSGPAAFIVSIDPEQTYFPKITSRITENGSMESNPLHMMTPDLPEHQFSTLTKYL